MDKNCCVLGLGRVGLPLSLALTQAGLIVYGIDINLSLVEKLRKREMPFMEKNADKILRSSIGKSFFPANDFDKIKECRYVIMTLGTPVDEHLNPDFSQIDAALPPLIKNLAPGQVIILRSTVAPGTTEYIKDMIEKETNFKIGSDMFLAFCPERIAEGNALEEIKEIPQIIGGIDHESSVKARELFSRITKECIITDAKSAELAKIFTNMYRYINFAIANEFAILAYQHKRDIHEILALANKNYKRGSIPQPGFTAGPCLYKDGFFLLNNIPFGDLISMSWRINENFPVFLLNEIKAVREIKNKKVALLGMGFKKNIDDTRNSLSFKLKKALEREQCQVFLHDPYIKVYDSPISEVLANASVVIIAMNHDAYKTLSPDYLKKYLAKDCIICDVWNITNQNRIIYQI